MALQKKEIAGKKDKSGSASRQAIGDEFSLPPPPVSIVASPLEKGIAVYAPLAPATAGTDDKPASQLNLDLFITNTGQVSLELSDFFMAFIPPPLVEVFPISVNQLVTNGLLSSPVIGPGGIRRLMVPVGELPYPTPRAITIELSFENFPGVAEVTLLLAPHVNCLPGGTYRFPLKLADLAQGEFVSGRIPGLEDGGVPAHHRPSPSQRFAYDLNVARWDPDEDRLRITFPGSSGNSNDDYLIWGKPIYAMAAGTILSCGRDIPDNPNPPAKITRGGGNVIWIRHKNGEVSMYAHIMQYSIPEHLCEPGYKVCENEFLGLVGNSGKSGGPHLHVHVQRGLPNDAPHASGRPLLFRGIHTFPASAYHPGISSSQWTYLDGHGIRAFPQFPDNFIINRRSLIWPAPFPPGGN